LRHGLPRAQRISPADRNVFSDSRLGSSPPVHAGGRVGGVVPAWRAGMTSFGDKDLDAILPRMERRADSSLFPTERARILNLAGDLCFDAGQRDRALIYYDQAIDIYLALGMYASVAAVCQKLVRLSPNVVRARCTLAWMAIARGQQREARERIADYASAALPQQDHSLARGHLRMMLEVVDSTDVLEAVGDALRVLGDARGAERAYAVASGSDFGSRKLPDEPERRWEVVIERMMTRRRN
jgi:tetratricopeptide (TPR) repeat protein